MSIEGKHAYRFGFLKSEQWQNVRIAALARQRGKCQLCSHESIHNDAHHVWYPKDIYKTKAYHLVILCRTCHELLHALRPECKTSDEAIGKNEWKIFSAMIKKWKVDKLHEMINGDAPRINSRDLRDAYEKLKEKVKNQQEEIEELRGIIRAVREAVFFSGIDSSDFVI